MDFAASRVHNVDNCSRIIDEFLDRIEDRVENFVEVQRAADLADGFYEGFDCFLVNGHQSIFAQHFGVSQFGVTPGTAYTTCRQSQMCGRCRDENRNGGNGYLSH